MRGEVGRPHQISHRFASVSAGDTSKVLTNYCFYSNYSYYNTITTSAQVWRGPSRPSRRSHHRSTEASAIRVRSSSTFLFWFNFPSFYLFCQGPILLAPLNYVEYSKKSSSPRPRWNISVSHFNVTQLMYCTTEGWCNNGPTGRLTYSSRALQHPD